VKYQPHKCPKCGAAADAELDMVPRHVGVRLDEEGRFIDRGEDEPGGMVDEVYWEGSETDYDDAGRVTLRCSGCRLEWPADVIIEEGEEDHRPHGPRCAQRFAGSAPCDCYRSAPGRVPA